MFVISIAGLFCAMFMFFAPAIAEQADELSRSVLDTVSRLAGWSRQYQWRSKLLENMSPENLMSGGSGSTASTAVSSTSGALGSFVIVLFIAIYGAREMPRRFAIFVIPGLGVPPEPF